MVFHKIGISGLFWDFAQKSGFQPPMSKIFGFQSAHGERSLRVHFEIQIFCHGRSCALEIQIFCKKVHMSAHGKKLGFQSAHGGHP